MKKILLAGAAFGLAAAPALGAEQVSKPVSLSGLDLSTAEGILAAEARMLAGAKKVALMCLVDMLRAEGVVLLDTQWCTDHLASLGCIEVPRQDYLRLLDSALS